MGRRKLEKGEAVTIKKYANRRLYDTQKSSYVTLDDLCLMVKEDIDFIVREAKTDKDITRSVLTQILLDQDSKNKNILPIGFLRNLIKFYDDGLEKVVSHYLDNTFEFFVRNQHRVREQLNKSLNTVNEKMPHVISTTSSVMEDLQRKNAELFEKAMDMVKTLRANDHKPHTGTQTETQTETHTKTQTAHHETKAEETQTPPADRLKS